MIQPVRAHVRYMDGLRGIAVLMVALYHGNEQGLLDNTLKAFGLQIELPSAFMRAGGAGVEIFYFISGFVLAYPLAQHAFEGRPRQTLRDYFGRRALKIVPSYAIALVTLTLFFPLEVPAGEPLVWHFLAHLFFIHGFVPSTFVSIDGPLWTLAIEVEFYVLFPSIARAFLKWPLATVGAMAAVTFGYTTALDLTHTNTTFFWSDQLPDFLDIFGAGMYAAWSIVRGRGRVRSRTAQRRWTAAAIVAVFVFYGILGELLTYSGYLSWAWSNDHRWFEAATLFVFALGIAFGLDWPRALLSSRVLLFLGTISYNLYLWNKNVYSWYRNDWSAYTNAVPWGVLGNVGQMLVTLAFPLAIATAMTYLIERPILAGGWSVIWRPTLAALRRIPSSTRPEERAAGGRAASFAAFFVPLALFVASMRHVGASADANELVTVSYVLGIAHPTGYPAFVALGWLVSHLEPFGWIAWRVIAISSVSTALATWLLARTIRRLGGEAWIATACALVFATGTIVWDRATDAGVAPLALALFAASLDCVSSYLRDGDRRRLIAAGALAGIGASVHPILLAMLPGLLAIAIRRGVVRSRDTLRAAATLLGAAAAGLVPYLLLPVRAIAIEATGGNPLARLGKPAGEAIWNYDDPRTFGNFVRLVTAADYGPPEFLFAWLDPLHAPARLAAVLEAYAGEIGAVTLVVALAGLAIVMRRDPILALALTSFALVPAFTAMGFGAGQDTDAYLVYGCWIAVAFLGVGASAAVRAYDDARRGVRRLCALTLLGCGALGATLRGEPHFAQPGLAPDAIVASVRAATPASAIVIAPWNFALPLAESAYAERDLAERTIDPALITDDVAYLSAWTRARPVYAVGVPAGFAGANVRLTLVAGTLGAADAVSGVSIVGPPAPHAGPLPPATGSSPEPTPSPSPSPSPTPLPTPLRTGPTAPTSTPIPVVNPSPVANPSP